jgi:peroxiredoxin Q/BCP
MSRELNPGTKAPRIHAPPRRRRNRFARRLRRKEARALLLPRADTSGCTKEAIDFSGLKGAFGKAGTEILGVSADPVPAQDKFKAKHRLSIALAPDEKHRMIEARPGVAESVGDRTRRRGPRRRQGVVNIKAL